MEQMEDMQELATGQYVIRHCMCVCLRSLKWTPEDIFSMHVMNFN